LSSSYTAPPCRAPKPADERAAMLLCPLRFLCSCLQAPSGTVSSYWDLQRHEASPPELSRSKPSCVLLAIFRSTERRSGDTSLIWLRGLDSGGFPLKLHDGLSICQLCYPSLGRVEKKNVAERCHGACDDHCFVRQTPKMPREEGARSSLSSGRRGE
jgi:hypothetical protein